MTFTDSLFNTIFINILNDNLGNIKFQLIFGILYKYIDIFICYFTFPKKGKVTQDF